MNCTKFTIFFNIAILLLSTTGVKATTLIVEDGKLVGATEVLVGNTLYDVTFIDKSAYDIFYNDEYGDYLFLFNSSDLAAAASDALLKYVLIDEYNNSPNLTYGITDSIWGLIYTPYQLSLYCGNETVDAYAVRNNAYGYRQDSTHNAPYLGLYLDFSSSSREVWAVWTLHTSSTVVPEPTTLLMFTIGIFGISYFCRKEKIIKT